MKKQNCKVSSSIEICQSYTIDYYTQDCGGFEDYQKNKGKRIEDVRLQSVATIAGIKKPGRLLDLGCGRGELTYYFAKQGFEVTAIDYSESAIQLAKKCFSGEESLRKQVQFYCTSVCNILLQDNYDLAVASDLIEHLSFEEVEHLYERVSRHLQPDGLFVIHTFPNLWYYQYDYTRRRKLAALVGEYLPEQPRSKYELLMHINEQSPRVLKKQLSRHFKYVLLWFADPQNPGGSLVKKFSNREICAVSSLFAIASHQPIDQEQLKNCLQMSPLLPIPAGEIELLVRDYPSEVVFGSEFYIQLEIKNNTKYLLNSYGDNPIHISYHWLDEQANDCIVFEGERTKIFPPLEGAEGLLKEPLLGNIAIRNYRARVRAIPKKGNYILRITLVQEGVRWFEQAPTHLIEDIPISIL